jgi:hypothetical protein
MNQEIFEAPARSRIRSRGLSPYLYGAAIVLILLFAAFIRFRLRDFPLERDEGEYAYMGQLMLQGIPPYKLAYNMKFPGTYAAFSAILAVFGQTPAAIHCGLILINALTLLVMFFLGARLFGRLAGLVACACYGLLSAGQSVMGMAAHATHFVVLPAIAGILLLLRAVERRRSRLFFFSGVLVGLACIMKQPGVYFVLFAGLYLILIESGNRPVDWRRLSRTGAAFLVGAVAPFALTCLLLSAAGVFGKFWFWTFSYAREYGSVLSLSQGLQQFTMAFPCVVAPSAFIWLAAAIGLVSILWNRASRQTNGFIIGFPLFSFFAVCPGFYFRPHYFILLLPAVGLLAGLAVSSACQFLRRRNLFLRAIPVFLILLAFGHAVARQSRFLFRVDPLTACLESYGPNPFAESLAVAGYIRNHTSKDARIAVLGSEPQIYFYSGRLSATGYLYTYALMEDQKYAGQMQQEMIAEIEKARPEYVVFVSLHSSWARRTNSEKHIFTWANEYLPDHYLVEGIVDIGDSGQAHYRWGEEAAVYEPRPQNSFIILRRRV